MLQILLDHDIYCSSAFDTKMYNDLQFFAESMKSNITSLFELNHFKDVSSICSIIYWLVLNTNQNLKFPMKLLVEQVKVLQKIFLLDHRLYHENLKEIFLIANFLYKCGALDEVGSLLALVLSIYSKLRQLPYFFSSFYKFIERNKTIVPMLCCNKQIYSSMQLTL